MSDPATNRASGGTGGGTGNVTGNDTGGGICKDIAAEAGTQRRGAIWDLPLRLFHWFLVLLIIGAWYTAENGLLDWHQRIGMMILFAMLFRIFWGFIGGSTARFSRFASGPARIRAYLKDGKGWSGIGHNPLGSLSVFALILVVSLQVGLGLFATDKDGLMEGPLAHFVPLDVSEQITDLHESLFNVMLALIALHLAAVVYYLVRGKNLVGPMVGGKGPLPDGTEPMVRAPMWAAPIALVIAWVIAGVIWSLGS